MKFMSILLSEGRKEDLKKRYSGKFKEYPDTLEFVLGISDLQDSNHKYTDFVLKNLHPNSSTDEIEDAVELVKDFEQFSIKLELKDINQYKSFEQLKNAIHKLKEVRRPKPESERIYENDTFLVLKPKNEEASCKYGSSTKWCVTQRGAGHYQRYTSGNQELYFIINKKNSTNQNYSKVAVHVDNYGNFSYWDAQDNKMHDREIKVLEYAFPELIQSINDDFKQNSLSKKNKFLNEVFQNFAVHVEELKNYLNSKASLEVHYQGFEIDESVGDGHATGRVAIQLYFDDYKDVIDVYETFIIYEGTESEYDFSIKVTFDGIDPSDSWEYIDLDLNSFEINALLTQQNTPLETANALRRYLSKRVLDRVKNDPKLITKIKGNGVYWNPNRSSYGYTFKKNKGLIKKLVDYLDNGTVGTKLDFLESIGNLKSKIVNGKKLYSHPNDNNYLPSSQFRGQFSSFFASAKLAGILNYRKIGKDYFLIKGPNFDTFKSGELRAL